MLSRSYESLSSGAQRKLILALALFFTSLTLTSCILPIPGSGKKPFERSDLGFVVPGETTRADIVTYFAGLETDMNRVSSKDSSVVIYRKKYGGGGVIFCAIAETGAGCGDARSASYDYVAVFLFGSDDRVKNYDLIERSLDRGYDKCRQFGQICVRENHVVLRADDTAQDHARQFVTSPETCSVYVYGEGEPEYRFRLDDWDAEFLDEDDFWLMAVDAGIHTITMLQDSGDRVFGSLDFECSPGQLVFIDGTPTEMTFFGSPNPQMMLVSEDIGRQKVEQRRLAAGTYPLK